MDFTATREVFAQICDRLVPLIPSRPPAPAVGCLVFDFSIEHGIRAFATDGMGIYAFHYIHPDFVHTSDGESEGLALVPATTLWDRVRAVPKPEMRDDTFRLSAPPPPAPARLVSAEGLTYTFQTLGSEHLFDIPRGDGSDPIALAPQRVFSDALQRASYAMGSEGSDPRARMLSVDSGRVYAYSSFGRAQEIRVSGLSDEASLLIPDGVLTPLLRWLRSFPADALLFLRSAALVPHGSSHGAAYVVLSVLDPTTGRVPSFAFPVPSAEFVDLEPVWRRASEQAAGAGTLRVHSWERFVALLRAARLSAPPAAPIGVIRLSGNGSGPVLTATTDDANNFEAPLGATYSGADPEREVAFSLDDMVEMLASLAYTDETSATLSIAPASVAVGGVRPFIQLVPAEGSDYRAVITQLDS